MVDLHKMSVSALSELIETYPWFAAARAAMCVKVLEHNGPDAAASNFRDFLIYFQDSGFVAGRLKKAVSREDFSDSQLADMIRSAVKERPHVVMAGMDYFSRDDYDAVRQDGDSSIAHTVTTNVSEPSAPVTENIEAPVCDLVTETLAQIYVDQGYPEEAVNIYQKLSLQSPEKSAYFASLIDKLKS